MKWLERKYGDEKNVKPSIISNVYEDIRGYEEIDVDATITTDSDGRRLIGSKWVFKEKPDGRFRARLVCLGYSQIPGVDFSDNYAPVGNDITFRVIMVLSLIYNLHAVLLDIETAFLYGKLEEEIYRRRFLFLINSEVPKCMPCVMATTNIILLM